jgi:TPP-dependent pyruvate/acetoin dehydrogenase alpha subunit
MDSDVKAIVTKATEFAQNSPEPDASELFTDILKPLIPAPVDGDGSRVEG